MGVANIFLLIFVIVLAVLALWWAFNTVHQIQLQKEFAAVTLTSTAKLWKKTQYVPEDARDRESLYLYRDFLAKYEDDTKVPFPLMVKDGNVRCMTRKEYDRACHQKDKRPVSILVLVATVLYAFCAIALNLANWLFGVGLAAIMPVWLIVLGIFINRFNKDKNNYREKLFATLQGNCADFLRLVKPYIVVDAYPQKFGKNARPKYVAWGELTDEQIALTKEFIIRQKSAETQIITRSVDNTDEIDRLQGKINPHRFETTVDAPTTPTNHHAAVPTPAAPVEPALPLAEKQAVLYQLLDNGIAAESRRNPTLPQPLSRQEKFDLLTKLVTDAVNAEQQRAQRAQQLAATPVEPLADLPPIPPVGTPATDTPEPDADDFSLDSIGIALDAELAKRRKKS